MTLLRHLVRRPSGEYTVHVDGHLADEGQTVRCTHCGLNWQVKPGSGVRRGWCHRCGGPTCGARGCATCTPYERGLAEMEQRAALWQSMEQGR